MNENKQDKQGSGLCTEDQMNWCDTQGPLAKKRGEEMENKGRGRRVWVEKARERRWEGMSG